MRYRHVLALVAAAGIAALLTACGQPSPTATPPPAATLSPAEEGERLFAVKGCATCHGLAGAGSDIAPALPGHSAEQVLRQVRSPVGSMPAFGAERISDQELDLIAVYVESLEAGSLHSEPTAIPLHDAVAMHHWMALGALADGATIEATHHVGHAVELIEDAEHRRRMEAVLGFLESGQLHDAEHEIEEMLGGTAEPGLSPRELHLQLALGAAQAGDGPEAAHHLEHFIADAGGTEPEGASEALEHIEAGELEEAGHAIVELIEAAEHQQHRHE